MQKKDLVTIRLLADGDLGLIYATWLKGLRYSNDWFEHIDQDIYFQNYHKVIQAILSRPTMKTFIACLNDDHDVTLGYAVTEPKTLHWVYVKPAWRRIGLARDLIPSDTTTVTHLTKMGIFLKPDNVIFNPFI